jgi:hypothetical protein
VHFVDNTGQTSQDWDQATKWSNSDTPNSASKVELTRSQAPAVQQVEVKSAPAFAYEVNVHDQSSPITLNIKNGQSLSASTGDVTIGENAAIALGDGTAGNEGLLATAASKTVAVQDGTLKGNGTVTTGNLLVSNGTMAPGFSVGHIKVEGNYTQLSTGAMKIDVSGVDGVDHDTITVSGQAQLPFCRRQHATASSPQ